MGQVSEKQLLNAYNMSYLPWIFTFALKYKHEYCSFLSSPLAVKRDIAVTILLRCMCVRVCMHACVRMSVRRCLGHNSFIYA